MSIEPRRGDFETFLRALLAFESGVDPARFDWYLENWANDVIDYPEVTAPGRVVRDPTTGACRRRKISVRDYFACLGVQDIFERGSAESLTRMQYRAMNPLGFVGFQIGEAILITAGYYEPEVVSVSDGGGAPDVYERYYFGPGDDRNWRNGCREVLYRIPDTDKTIVATDVNRWQGTFTGLDGVNNLEDLMLPARQRLVIRRILDANYQCIEESLVLRGCNVQSAMPLASGAITVSGLLAGAHLCGPHAVVRFLLEGTVSKDEFGTSLLEYLGRFSAYDTPYDRLQPAQPHSGQKGKQRC